MAIEKHVTQRDEVCLRCGEELLKGDHIWLDNNEEIMCQECYNEIIIINNRQQMGKGINKILGKQGKILNYEQEKFCQLYASSEEFFGNGIKSYVAVYKIDKLKSKWYESAAAAASRLLSDVKVCKRINEILDKEGLNDNFIDKQLLFLITQHGDFNGKIQAIKEYNKLKQRIVDKIEINKPLLILK